MSINMTAWMDDLRGGRIRKAMPVLSFPSVQLMGITVRELIGSSERQAEGMVRVAERCEAAAAVSMMDLSVEAEAFGSPVRVSDWEVPTVAEAIVHDEEDARALRVPAVGDGRSGRYVEAIGMAARRIGDRPVLAGVIGPFSLAGRLIGVEDAMAGCYDEPEMVRLCLEKATAFLIDYIRAYREAGASGVVMAEPLAGLLSPTLHEQFAAPYCAEIIRAVQAEDFPLIYHNCGGNTPRLAASLAGMGAAAYHFGDAVSMADMLSRFPADVPLLGNVSPSRQFLSGTPASVREETLAVMAACCPGHPNFLISSGCDIPPQSPWENIDAFFAAAAAYYETEGAR